MNFSKFIAIENHNGKFRQQLDPLKICRQQLDPSGTLSTPTLKESSGPKGPVYFALRPRTIHARCRNIFGAKWLHLSDGEVRSDMNVV